MQTKLAVLAALTLIPSLALAEAPTPAPTPEPEPAVAARARLGVELALLPVGSLKAAAGGASAEADMTTTFGLGGTLQFTAGRYLTIDFAPRMVFGIKSEGDSSSAKQLDARVRFALGNEVSPGVRLYAAAIPGYSFLFLPEPLDRTPSGFAFALAGGGSFRIGPKARMTAELGYQFGFQSTDVMGEKVEISTDMLHLSLGLLFDL